MLHAYIDDTEVHHGHPKIFGVGGFLFLPKAVQEFDAEWTPRIEGLPKPYRTALCFGGRYPFLAPDWSTEQRKLLIRDLARLTARTRDLGFVAFTHSDEYEAYAAEEPKIVGYAGSPYALCLLACVDLIVGYVKKSYPNEDVRYWIESGSKNEQQAMDFIRRINDNGSTRDRFRLSGYGFYTKAEASALCAADLLCWEWQRNYVEAHKEADEGQWRDTFKLLFQDEGSKPIVPVRLGKTGIGIRAMVHRFYHLHQD